MNRTTSSCVLTRHHTAPRRSTEQYPFTWTVDSQCAVPKTPRNASVRTFARLRSLAIVLSMMGVPAGLLGAESTLTWNLIGSGGVVQAPDGTVVGHYASRPVESTPVPQPVQPAPTPQPAPAEQSPITWNLIHSDGRVTAPNGDTVGYAPWAPQPTPAPAQNSPVVGEITWNLIGPNGPIGPAVDPLSMVFLNYNNDQLAALNLLAMGLAQEARYAPGKALSINASQKQLVERAAGRSLNDQQALAYFNSWVMMNKNTRERDDMINQAQRRTTGPMRTVSISRKDARGNTIQNTTVTARFTDAEVNKIKYAETGAARASLNLFRLAKGANVPMLQLSPYEGQTWEDWSQMRPYASDVSAPQRAGALAKAKDYENQYGRQIGDIYRSVQPTNPYYRWMWPITLEGLYNGSYDRQTLLRNGFSEHQINQVTNAQMGMLVARYNQSAIVQSNAALPYKPIEGQPWADWRSKAAIEIVYNAAINPVPVNSQLVQGGGGRGPVSTYPTPPSQNNPFITQVHVPNTNITLWFNPTIVAPLPMNPFGTNVSEGLAWGIYNPDNPGDGSRGAVGFANALLGGIFSTAVRAVGTAIHSPELGQLFSNTRSFVVQNPVYTPPIIPQGNG